MADPTAPCNENEHYLETLGVPKETLGSLSAEQLLTAVKLARDSFTGGVDRGQRNHLAKGYPDYEEANAKVSDDKIKLQTDEGRMRLSSDIEGSLAPLPPDLVKLIETKAEKSGEAQGTTPQATPGCGATPSGMHK